MNLGFTEDTEPEPHPLKKGTRKRPTSMIWVSALGASLAIVAAIGGYVYTDGLGKTTADIEQDQKPPDASRTAISSEPSQSSVDDRASHGSPEAERTNTPQEATQEADGVQILALAEAKVLEVKQRAAQTAPSKRGDRKTARAANGRGLAELQSGRVAEAISAFQEGHQADPADVEVLNNLGHAYLMQGDLESADRYILATLALAPQRTAAWSDLGQVYGKKGDTKTAVASFANAYRFSQHRDKTHQFFLGLMERENDPNLKQALQQAIQVAEKTFLTTRTP